jgi:hypothetical protein
MAELAASIRVRVRDTGKLFDAVSDGYRDPDFETIIDTPSCRGEVV